VFRVCVFVLLAFSYLLTYLETGEYERCYALAASATCLSRYTCCWLRWEQCASTSWCSTPLSSFHSATDVSTLSSTRRSTKSCAVRGNHSSSFCATTSREIPQQPRTSNQLQHPCRCRTLIPDVRKNPCQK